MIYTVGFDVGASSVKSVLTEFDDLGKQEQLHTTHLNKIRKRDIKEVIAQSYEKILSSKNLSHQKIAYVATTGEGDMVDFRRGHFYSMTSHARGALYLNPEARAVVDAGALHTRALKMDARSKVLSYRMTSQCASGTGQFLENISRYLGIAIENVGVLSKQAGSPQSVSSICAVLAETDVINMVSRGIEAKDILKGVHVSMAKRIVALLKALSVEGPTMVTGGLANDEGFLFTLQEVANKEKLNTTFCRHDLSVFAGAIGAALWGAFRYVKLQEKDALKEVSL